MDTRFWPSNDSVFCGKKPSSEGRVFFCKVRANIMKDKCPFCNPEIDKQRFGRLQQKFPENILRETTNVLYENKSFVIYPELHPAAKGVNTVLIAPRDHFLSFQLVPEDQYGDFQEVVEVVREKLGKKEKSITWFEHGTGVIDTNTEAISIGKSIYHAHIHASIDGTDLYSNLHSQIKRTFGNADVAFHEVANDREPLPYILAQAALGLPYLYLGEDDHGIVMVENEEVKVPSQYLRREIAKAKQQEFIDWKTMDDRGTQEMADRLFATMLLWYS